MRYAPGGRKIGHPVQQCQSVQRGACAANRKGQHGGEKGAAPRVQEIHALKMKRK